MLNIFVFILFICLTFMASATPGEANFDPPGPFTASFGTINVQRDLPVGSTIASTSLNNNSMLYTDGSTRLYETMSYNGAVSAGLSDGCIFKTNLEGVGIKFDTATNHGSFCATSSPGGTDNYIYTYGGYTIYSGAVYLIKTGNITPGTLVNGELGMLQNAKEGANKFLI